MKRTNSRWDRGKEGVVCVVNSWYDECGFNHLVEWSNSHEDRGKEGVVWCGECVGWKGSVAPVLCSCPPGSHTASRSSSPAAPPTGTERASPPVHLEWPGREREHIHRLRVAWKREHIHRFRVAWKRESTSTDGLGLMTVTFNKCQMMLQSLCLLFEMNRLK